MQRLTFLSPDAANARAVVRDLRADGIANEHIYAIAKTGTSLEGLPYGGPDDDDFLPAFLRGIALGGATAVVVGVLGTLVPGAGIISGADAVSLFGVMGASVGGLIAGIAGSAFRSSRLGKFDAAIEAGRILIMADVPADRIEHVNELVRRRDPEVGIAGPEPRAPIIPRSAAAVAHGCQGSNIGGQGSNWAGIKGRAAERA